MNPPPAEATAPPTDCGSTAASSTSPRFFGEETAPPTDRGPRGEPFHKRVLFLEEDPRALEHVKALIAARPPAWEAGFCSSVTEALDWMQHQSVDAVVTGLRFPHARTLQFVNEVARRFPRTLRFVRCAPEDRALLRHCVGTPHFVSDEVDAAALESAVDRGFRLEEWLAQPGLRHLMGQIRKLPALPGIYAELTARLQSPDVPFDEVARLISHDPVMTAKILQLVNSAYFAFPREITSAYEAVLLLGLEKTRALVLLVHVFSAFEATKCPGFSLEALWRHSLATAASAKAITEHETDDLKLAEMAFTAGLLHDVGKLLLAGNLPLEYSHVLQLAREQNRLPQETERETFGASHAELAACVLGTWGLPLKILEAIGWHHTPRLQTQPGFEVLTAVHVANALCRQPDSGSTEAFKQLDRDYLVALGLDGRLEIWQTLAQRSGRPNRS